MNVSIALLFAFFTAAMAQLNLVVDVGTHHKLVEGRHGLFLINKADTWIGRSLDEYG